MQEFKKDGLNLFRPSEPIKVKAPELKLPDAHEMAKLAGLRDLEAADEEDRKEAERDAARAEEAEQEEERRELEARAAAREARLKERRRRVICCCGSRTCRIGVFNRVVEEEV